MNQPIAWIEAGGGPPVIFLHGVGGSRTAWGPQLRGLSDRFRCIAWDMPGYGDSELLEPLTFEAIADRLVGLLDTLAIERADLVGLSFGGMQAMHAALRHPERVNRLVLADTSPRFGANGTTAAEWTAARMEPLDRGETPADAAERVIDAITSVTLTGQIRDEVVGAYGRIPVDGFRASLRCLPTHDVLDRLDAIAHPTRVIVGELDEETPIAYSQSIADGIPHSDLRILDGVGHLSPSEAPDRFNALVAEFLSAH
ncbi:MAG: alpha/beta fold hydrolase [Actinobacteria bacterium]|nr:alpha/beta fold hydrolase [Actinomycetota bacterium]NCG36593.1 alpha/beta fold hydrolase [Actinomycetota bacterium]